MEQLRAKIVVPDGCFGTTQGGKVKRALGKKELLAIVPLSLSTIYRLEKKGVFPLRWHITDGRCVWNADEVERWLDERQASFNEPVNQQKAHKT